MGVSSIQLQKETSLGRAYVLAACCCERCLQPARIRRHRCGRPAAGWPACGGASGRAGRGMPGCGVISTRVHAWVKQRVRDIPAGGDVVEVVDRKPRMPNVPCTASTASSLTMTPPARSAPPGASRNASGCCSRAPTSTPRTPPAASSVSRCLPPTYPRLGGCGRPSTTAGTRSRPYRNQSHERPDRGREHRHQAHQAHRTGLPQQLPLPAPYPATQPQADTPAAHTLESAGHRGQLRIACNRHLTRLARFPTGLTFSHNGI